MSSSITLTNNSCFSQNVDEFSVFDSLFANQNQLFDVILDQDEDIEISKIESDNFIIKDSLRQTIKELNRSLISFNSISISTEKLEDEKVNIMEIFEDCRGFTKEEAELYEESLDEIFEPTGKKFFDL